MEFQPIGHYVDTLPIVPILIIEAILRKICKSASDNTIVRIGEIANLGKIGKIGIREFYGQ
ncbi:hypothetical protein GCM10027355_36170 [Haloplanus salinarum]